MTELNVSVNLSVIGIGIILLMFILYLATQIGKIKKEEGSTSTNAV
jgi:MFS transporter, LPLT family, lysophospholipid transporter